MRIELSTRDRDRFERFVDRSGGPDACHPWTGYVAPNGYGQFRMGGTRRRVEYAHRVAWVLAGHEITHENPNILHDCPNGDLRACCNDRHLWDGTYADNQLDMATKDRGRKSAIGLPFGVRKRQSGRFGSQVQVNGKSVWLGTFSTVKEASDAAITKKREYLS